MLPSANPSDAKNTQRSIEQFQGLRFPTQWRELSDPPNDGGTFIVDLGHQRICAAVWVPTVGFTLEYTEYIGLEHRIIGWMELPRGR